jgi:hypothetical protein
MAESYANLGWLGMTWDEQGGGLSPTSPRSEGKILSLINTADTDQRSERQDLPRMDADGTRIRDEVGRNANLTTDTH